MKRSPTASGPPFWYRRGFPQASGATGLVLLFSGMVGSAAAAILLIEKFTLLTNPFHVPSCNISAAVNCGAVMTSPQAEVLGFPNPVIGLGTFPVVAAVGAAVLAGGQLRPWFWNSLSLGALLGWAFVHYLIVQSVFVIGALCPYCMVVWVCTAAAALAAVSVPAASNRTLRVIAQYAPSIFVTWLSAIGVLVAGALANLWGA